MSGVLLQTLAWTGVLIAVVLLLRRPVAKAFGPEAAYALWALPAARLLLPPLTLPAWMAAPASLAPAGPAAPVPEPASEPLVLDAIAASPDIAPLTGPMPTDLPTAAPARVGFDGLAWLADTPVLEVLLLVWLGGAGVFLWRRFAAYFDLRDALLAEGREVGVIRLPLGRVRLVETPATPAPLAMGVLDRVIAMPPGFMALHDRRARDLALAHELAHHRGGDLLVNILVQPLFALHWFNPLARFGWLALRRDQEAACDARVMAHRDAAERAAYAALIARFAASSGAAGHAALTAPMACPVLGEKSIIHRLRSLSMTHLSPRRRMAGRALLGAGLLALPLTATIGYAAADTVLEAPEPPAPPAPPAAPNALEPPEAPPAPDGADLGATTVIIERELRGAEAELRSAEAELRAAERDIEVSEHVWRDADGTEKRVKMMFRGTPEVVWLERDEDGGSGAHAAETEAMRKALREGLAEAERVRKDMPRIIEEALAASQAARAAAPRVIVRQECKPGSKEVSETTTGKDGTQVVTICQSRMFSSARSGLERARDEIARDKEIPEETRKQLLKHLDRQIARWSEKEG